jgi:hypothetical protein
MVGEKRDFSNKKRYGSLSQSHPVATSLKSFADFMVFPFPTGDYCFLFLQLSPAEVMNEWAGV